MLCQFNNVFCLGWCIDHNGAKYVTLSSNKEKIRWQLISGIEKTSILVNLVYSCKKRRIIFLNTVFNVFLLENKNVWNRQKRHDKRARRNWALN